MTILHILAGCETGRAEDYAAELTPALAEAGLDQVVVIHGAAPSGIILAKITHAKLRIYRLPVKGWRRFWLRRLIARLQPQLIQCWTRGAARLLPRNPVPLIVWLSGYDRPSYFRADASFVTPGADAIARLRKDGVEASRAHFIPVFAPAAASPPLDRNILTTPREAKVILSFSRLHPASQLDTVLAALQTFPEAYAWLAGEGPIRRELERKAEASGVMERMRFTGPSMDRNALLRAADVCLLTAPEEPLGTAIAESWAAGTPLITVRDPASLVPAAMDNVGLPISAGDDTALKLALQRLWGDEELRRRLIAQGFAAYIKNYAREAVIRQWCELYRRRGLEARGQEI